MFTDFCIYWFQSIDALVFNNWIDAFLEKIQFLMVCFDQINNFITPAISAMRVVTYFFPIQHLTFFATIIMAYLGLKTIISFYILINPLK